MQPRSDGVASRIKDFAGAGQRDSVRAGGIGVSLPSLVIPFVKASACGNDFLLIDASTIRTSTIDPQAAVDLAGNTRRMCDRHEGVGADGVEWMFPHPAADVAIRLINADGSEAEISGNGTRCVAAYVC